MGLGILSDKPFLEVIDHAFPHIMEILDEMCEEEKEHMKALPPTHLGSWSRGVTTRDGRWQIRGHFSQNCTFVIKNYLTGGLLYYGHLSMRGADKICIKSYGRVHQRLQRVIWHRFCGQKQKKGSILRLIGRMPTHRQQRDFVMHIQMSKSRGSCCVGHVGRTHGKKL